jgi:hypothetical protein
LLDTAIINQGTWFGNFPLEKNGSRLFLGRFKAMSPSALAIWIQHLALSFTEGSSYDRKFKFLTKKGSSVDVTMVHGSNAGAGMGNPVSEKKVKEGKKKEGKTKEGKTRKLASRKWEKGERGKGKGEKGKDIKAEKSRDD